jgi:hypothetical protein
LVDLVVRHFKPGDEAEVVKLFNDEYAAYGGFVPRTEAYWRWCCLDRPGVEEEGVLLACDGETGELWGYAVAGLSGNVWEFCAAGDRERVASFLLREVVKYLDGAGVSSVNVNLPNDTELAGVFEQEGFARVPVDSMFVSTLSPAELLSTLVVGKRMPFDESIGFELDDTPFGVEKRVSVRIRQGETRVEGGLSELPSIVVRMSFASFLSVLFGVSGAYRHLLTRRMRVRPFWKFGRVVSFLNVARLCVSWFWPLGDWG